MPILDINNIRENVWLYAWGQTMREGHVTTVGAANYADQCLKDFDDRFPKFKNQQE